MNALVLLYVSRLNKDVYPSRVVLICTPCCFLIRADAFCMAITISADARIAVVAAITNYGELLSTNSDIMRLLTLYMGKPAPVSVICYL